MMLKNMNVTHKHECANDLNGIKARDTDAK